MTELETTPIVETQDEPTLVNPFSEDWKTSPTIIEKVISEPVVELEEVTTPVVAEEKNDTPPIVEVKFPEEIKFANEESEKIYNLLKEGKNDDVYSILSEQKKLSEVDKLSPSDVIKLNLQYQNKDFTASEVNDLFNENYEIPEKPEQGEYETDEDYAVNLSKYEKELKKVESKIARDSKPAIVELQKLQKEIVLPDIPKLETPVNEPTQEELEAQSIQAEKFLQSINEGLNNFKGYETTFKDEEVELNVAYKLTAEEKKEIQPLIALANSDAAAFLQGIGWLDKDGNINTSKLTEDLPVIMNKANIFQKLVSETGNKRHEASVKAIKNISYTGGGKSSNDVGETPEQQQIRMASHFFQN